MIRPLHAALGLGLLLPPPATAAQQPCDSIRTLPAASDDLYCIHLLPAAGQRATGTAQMDWPGGPFTSPASRGGLHRWDLTFNLEDLPPLPAGRAPGFVAWVAPPSLTPMVRLGTVRAGRTTLGPVALEQFLVLVSAEPDTTARERTGLLVIRGQSASSRLRPADNYDFFLGAIGVPRPADAGAAHRHDGAAIPDSLGWTPVPMMPGIDMLPSEMALRPPIPSWRPPAAEGIPAARPREIVRLASGDTLDLAAGMVRRSIAGRAYTMFGFNGQYPGPLLEVPQGAEIVVRYTNRLPMPSTVHWHGLRLDARFDGVPDVSQPAVAPGASFTYRLRFPDGGVYWYHPHVREDIQQDLGLYGNIFVRPARPFPPVDREEFLILDDLLMGDDGLVPWGLEEPTHAAMGRFGNVMLVNGEPGWRLQARPGEVLRLYLTNAANARTFNLSFSPVLPIKVIGSDLGTYAREAWVESVVIGPAERYIVEVRFPVAGIVTLRNEVRALDHLNGRFVTAMDTLGTVEVAGGPVGSAPGRAFDGLRTDSASAAETVPLLRRHQGLTPDRILELRATFVDLPFVTHRLMQLDSLYAHPVEWAGTMPGMNWATVGGQAHWTLRDHATGLENHAIVWTFRRGDLVRLRLVGLRESLHGMQHPIHLHGQRFLVLAVNGVPNENPVWKDTVLVPAGGAVDLLVEMSNPGRWMLHCHIAEHLQAGMMMTLDVENR